MAPARHPAHLTHNTVSGRNWRIPCRAPRPTSCSRSIHSCGYTGGSMQRVRPPVVLVALALLGSAGCEDRPLTGADAREALQGASPRPPQSNIGTSDDEFARVARAEVPGFAGYYLDG